MPWYIRNIDIDRNLVIATLKEENKRFTNNHEDRLRRHDNAEILRLLDNQHHVRRLKRTKPCELVQCVVFKNRAHCAGDFVHIVFTN